MSEANKTLVRRMLEEGFTKHNAAIFDELLPDCTFHSPSVGELRGYAYRQFLGAVLAAFPDGRWTIEDQVAEGDKVVTRWTFVGTHEGELMGIRPTNKKVAISGIMIGGRIAEEWEEPDTLGMMQQLGAIAQLSS
jgi:predicted ester cyclase